MRPTTFQSPVWERGQLTPFPPQAPRASTLPVPRASLSRQHQSFPPPPNLTLRADLHPAASTHLERESPHPFARSGAHAWSAPVALYPPPPPPRRGCRLALGPAPSFPFAAPLRVHAVLVRGEGSPVVVASGAWAGRGPTGGILGWITRGRAGSPAGLE